MAKNYAEYAFGLLVGQFVSDRYRLIQLKSPRFFTVDGKMMRRSGLLRRTGSTSTHGVVEVAKRKEEKEVITCVPYLPLAPWQGNTTGGLLAHSRSLVKGEGLAIATWARPPRLTLGAALLAYHYPLPQVVAKQSAGNDCASDCLGDRWGSLGAIRALCCRTA